MQSNNTLGSVGVLGTNKADNLIAGVEVTPMTQDVLLLADQGELARGSVIGIITASGKGKLTDSGSADGSQVANLILAETVDTTGADTVATAYKAGVFTRDLLIFGGGGAPTTFEQDLRDVNIHLKDRAPY